MVPKCIAAYEYRGRDASLPVPVPTYTHNQCNRPESPSLPSGGTGMSTPSACR